MQPVDQPATTQCFSPVQFSAVTAVDEYVGRRGKIIYNLSELEAPKHTDQVVHDVSQFETIVNKDLKVDGLE